MNDFIYTEKFDKYLKGKLDDSEKLALEEEIRQDPLLNHEVGLQKDIYRALGDERHMLLKSRLDDVTVNTSGWLNLTGLQWAAVITSFFLISTGSYYYLEYKEPSLVSATIDISYEDADQPIVREKTIPEIPLPLYKEEAPEDGEMSASIETTPDTDFSRSEKRVEADELDEESSLLTEIVRPDVMSDFAEEDQQINYTDFEAPDKTIFEKAEISTADVTVETAIDADYSFHYKLKDQKLFLYGDFQGIPYKIIALNREGNKKLFLEYLDKYYSLDQSQTKVVPLIEIKDPAIVKALERLSQ